MSRMLLAFASIVSVLSFCIVIITGVISDYGLLTILTRGVAASLISLPLFLGVGYFLLPVGQDGE